MHTTVDYSKSPSARFDAVEDIKSWLGAERWALVSPEMAKVINCGQFVLYASLAGVQGFPVRAWYELYQGEGSWKEEELEPLHSGRN